MALKKMPSVGDVVQYIGEDFGYLITGKRYTVIGIDEEDGEPYFIDEDGEEEYIRERKFDWFNLVEEVKKGVGYLIIAKAEKTDDDLFLIEMIADTEGYESIKKLEQKSAEESNLRHLDERIRELEEALEKAKKEREQIL